MLISPAFAKTTDIYIAYKDTTMQEIERQFKENVKPNGEILFTYVPRGLIVSIDEKVFFNQNNDKIKQNSITVLNEIGKIINNSEKLCVIEGHTESLILGETPFKSNWELSLARANNIAKYFMRYLKINPNKIVSMGFGEFMPFSDSVSDKAVLNNRIDFVILNYETKR